MFFEDDLRVMYSDAMCHDVTVKTGVLADKTFKAQFDTSHLKRNLAGHPINTLGHVITGIASDFKGLDKSDTLSVGGTEYEITRIINDSCGLIRIETRESLEGVISHGEL